MFWYFWWEVKVCFLTKFCSKGFKWLFEACCVKEDIDWFCVFDSTSENKRRNRVTVKNDSTQAWTGGFLRDWQMWQPLPIGTYRIAKFWSFGISGQMACVRSFHHRNPNCYKKSRFIEIRVFNNCFSWTPWIILVNFSSWQRKGKYLFQSGHCCQPRNVF